MERILVTGAGGYIGRHVVSALCDMGAEVIAVSSRSEGIDPRAQVLARDIFAVPGNVFQELGSPDVCLHMAWRDGFRHNSPAHMENLSRHYVFLREMMEGGLKQLAVMGSMHEVGYWEGPIDEDTPCNPISMYGVAKDALRRSTMLLTAEKGVCLQWLRAYYIYGDDMFNNSIFTKLLQAAERGDNKLYLVANVLGWIVSVLNAFFWNNRLVFSGGEQDWRSIGKRLLRTYVSYAATMLLATVLLHFEVQVWGISEFIAPLINICVTTPINFVANKFWTFAH